MDNGSLERKDHTIKLLTRIGTLVAAGCLAATTVPAAAAPTEITHTHDKPSWEQFRAETFRDADGQYIVNGDVPVPSTVALYEFYTSLPDGESDHHHPEQGGTGDLIVNTDRSGQATLWSDSQARNLTYCVSDSFGSRKASVVNAMEYGAAMWEQASSGVDFRYEATQDRSCNTSNNNVVFSVEPTNATGYVARAFFPDSPKSQRNILVAGQFYSSGSQQGPIMGHELGHVLGFRHEHTRPEAGTCFEDSNWLPLTPYDSASVMHYPQCNGSARDLSFSEYDRQGVQRAYGS